MRPLIKVFVVISLLAYMAVPVFAKGKPEPWADTPTSFTLYDYQVGPTWSYAQSVITNWSSYEGGLTPMKIQTVTDSLIQTYNPDDDFEIGFTITRIPSNGTQQIIVTSLYQETNVFTAHRDAQDALKRARHLSYLLLQYAATVSKPADPTPQEGAGDTDLDTAIKLLQSQLQQQKYNEASETLKLLESMVSGRASVMAATAPVSPPDQHAAASPAVPTPSPTIGDAK